MIHICIKIDDAGQISVGTMDHEAKEGMAGGMKPELQETPLMGGAAEGGESMQPVASIDEALEVARGLLEGQGAEMAGKAQAAFEDGYGGETRQMQGGGM